MEGAIVYVVIWTEFNQLREHFRLHESKEEAERHYTQLILFGFPNVYICQPLDIEKEKRKHARQTEQRDE